MLAWCRDHPGLRSTDTLHRLPNNCSLQWVLLEQTYPVLLPMVLQPLPWSSSQRLPWPLVLLPPPWPRLQRLLQHLDLLPPLRLRRQWATWWRSCCRPCSLLVPSYLLYTDSMISAYKQWLPSPP
ncbi:hypothetical protein MTO96_029173 [Rhipicephalus appendiculatus]